MTAAAGELGSLPLLDHPADCNQVGEVSIEEHQRIGIGANCLGRGELRKERRIRDGLSHVDFNTGSERDDV